MLPPLRVLIVDDEKNIRTTLSAFLEQLECNVRTAPDGPTALFAVSREAFDVVFLDLRIGQTSGLDFLPSLLAESPGSEVIVITAFATYETAVSAIKLGARNYLPKPFDPVQVQRIILDARERRSMRARLNELEWQLRDGGVRVEFATVSPKMAAVVETLNTAARYDTPVLLRGESGTGKGMLAHMLHAGSNRSAKPFIIVHCPTFTDDSLASALMGHGKQPGKIEAAATGTLFLDEIGDLSPLLQARILRLIQNHTFERVGETKTRQADVRIVASTHRDLAAVVAAGQFRQDLFYSLNTIDLTVPPLRDRPEDVPLLARQFVTSLAAHAGKPGLELSPAAERVLTHYGWPGNVRELRNVIERAVILAQGKVIGPELLPVSAARRPHPEPALGGEFTLEVIEREHIQRVLLAHPGPDEAAKILGIDPSTLWRKRKRYTDAVD